MSSKKVEKAVSAIENIMCCVDPGVLVSVVLGVVFGLLLGAMYF